MCDQWSNLRVWSVVCYHKKRFSFFLNFRWMVEVGISFACSILMEKNGVAFMKVASDIFFIWKPAEKTIVSCVVQWLSKYSGTDDKTIEMKASLIVVCKGYLNISAIRQTPSGHLEWEATRVHASRGYHWTDLIFERSAVWSERSYFALR